MNTKIAKKVLMKNFYNSEFSSTKYAKIIGDIYHYTSVDGIIGILKNKELWFTNIYFLNDNQELFYTYKLINEVVKEIKNDLSKTFYEKIKARKNYLLSEDYFDNESNVWGRQEYYVASFSTDKDSLALWNYYTKSDTTGYNICFKDYAFCDHSVAQGKICYNRIEQKQMLKDTILKYNKKYNNAPNNEKKNIIRELFYNFIIYSLFFKNEKYMIENEYRIVMPVCNSSTDEEENCYYRHKKGLIIPYIKFDLNKLKNNATQHLGQIIDKIKISPLNQGNITKYGVTRLAHCADLYDCEITFSEADMKY